MFEDQMYGSLTLERTADEPKVERRIYTIRDSPRASYLRLVSRRYSNAILYKDAGGTVTCLSEPKITRCDWATHCQVYSVQEVIALIPHQIDIVIDHHIHSVEPFLDMRGARICKLNGQHAVVKVHPDDRTDVVPGGWVRVMENERSRWQTVEITRVDRLGVFSATR